MFQINSLAISLGLLLAHSALAELKRSNSLELETKFFVAPSLLELRVAGQIKLKCVAVVAKKSTGKLTIGDTSAKEGQCPTDIASYFENSDISDEFMKQAKFDESKMFEARQVEGQSRILSTFPVASFYSFLNPATGKEEYEAYCSTFTYLDPDVHEGEPSLRLIHYKRIPVPEKLNSVKDDVTCGDINYAYENEIKTRLPKARQPLVDDTVRHNTLAGRGAKEAGTPTSDRSNHQGK